MRVKLLGAAFFILSPLAVNAQSYETQFTRSLSDVFEDVQKQFGIRLKYNVDTTGLKLPYADFRIRPYSVEETLKNLCAPFDFVPWDQGKDVWKIKPYEYPRRKPEDGKKLIDYLNTLYNNKAQWEARKDSLRREVRQRLGIDPLLEQSRAQKSKMQLGKTRKHDGYSVQNFNLPTVNNHTIKGSIYTPQGKKNIAPSLSREGRGGSPLIICPIGHWNKGRYNEDLQRRLASLARMGAICVTYDIWGWGESEDEVGAEAHHTPEAHVMQTLHGIRILDEMLKRKDVDKNRVAVNGGSGGGSQTVLLSLLDDRYTAACPVVSMAAWFDGGCPCESGIPIMLSGGGTCNPELAACFAPKPMMVVSDGGDWTEFTPVSEYPYLQRVYGFYGAQENVKNVHLPSERHDFGPNKRQAVYDFFIDVFGLDRSKLNEEKVTIEEENTLRFSPKKK
ncbi:MAG: hypothetical protein IJK46_12815 [Prevotella sp.]|nr:hypothetical protein [Prevotella sp.]